MRIFLDWASLEQHKDFKPRLVKAPQRKGLGLSRPVLPAFWTSSLLCFVHPEALYNHEDGVITVIIENSHRASPRGPLNRAHWEMTAYICGLL